MLLTTLAETDARIRAYMRFESYFVFLTSFDFLNGKFVSPVLENRRERLHQFWLPLFLIFELGSRRGQTGRTGKTCHAACNLGGILVTKECARSGPLVFMHYSELYSASA